MFLNYRVSYLRFRVYLANEVHGPLHSKRMALLAVLDYNGTANDMSSRRNIE
jgi:hypothetical protein